ncbi:hypothetical protein B8A45_00335 [Dolosigranulum pigrum]|nr:hypothetical protein B8A45_00335 [Dolosigranulum pigrum]
MILTFFGAYYYIKVFCFIRESTISQGRTKMYFKKDLIEAAIGIINISEIVVDIGVQAVIYAN